MPDETPEDAPIGPGGTDDPNAERVREDDLADDAEAEEENL